MSLSGDQNALHVIHQGPEAAPALVLLHSIATNSTLWAAQIPVWSRSFRVLAVDLPGHGASPPDPRLENPGHYTELIANLLDRCGISHCSIVGLSLGGLIGQMFALEHPDRCRSLVIANSSARTPPEMQQRWETRKRQALEEGMESQVDSTLERWFTPEFRARSALTVRWVADMIRGTHPHGYRAAIEAIQAVNTLDRLPSIQCPVLVVAGRRDTATTVENLQNLAAELPAARLEVLESASHLSNLVQPVEFTECVGAFLDQTRGVRPG
jgi:3-oxoadipate enol-lactonase